MVYKRYQIVTAVQVFCLNLSFVIQDINSKSAKDLNLKMAYIPKNNEKDRNVKSRNTEF